MNIESIKLGLELWDNRYPLDPPSDKHAEILYETVKQRAEIFENDAVENVRYLLSIIEQAEKAIEQLGKMDDPDKIEKFAEQALKAIQGEGKRNESIC